MGYLLYCDVLGFSSLLARNPRLAESALNKLYSLAIEALNDTIPGSARQIKGDSQHSLVVFQDSLFFHVGELALAVQFSATLARSLFLLPKDKGGPIAVRGTIIETTERVSLREHITLRTDVKATGSYLLVRKIGESLLAEKSKLLGPRIVFKKELLPKNTYEAWDYRLQAKVGWIFKLPGTFDADILQADKSFEEYYDVLWMNGPQFGKVLAAIREMQFHAAFSQRPSLHAAAALAMYRSTEIRRRGLVVILRRLWNGITARDPALKGARPKKNDYDGWLKAGQEIQRKNNAPLVFPLSMETARLPKSLTR